MTYGGCELRQAVRARGMGYVLAVRATTAVTACPGTTITAAGAVQPIPDRAWQRLRTGSGTKGVRHPPGPPALERLRRRDTVITNYSCRISA